MSPSLAGPQDLETKTQKLPEVDLDTVPMLEEPGEDMDDLAEHTFPKFAATYFQKSASHTHSRRPLRYPLLYHDDEADCSVPGGSLVSSRSSHPQNPDLRCGSVGTRKGQGHHGQRCELGSSWTLCLDFSGCPGCVEHHLEVHG